MADIKFVGDHIETEGKLLAKGEIAAAGGLSSSSGEITSTGAVAGFSFADRAAKPEAQASSDRGVRWVWYSNSGTARLWSGGVDMVTVDMSFGTRPKVTFGGNVVCPDVQLGSIASLTATIAELQKRIAALEAKTGTAPPPQPAPFVPAGGNGRPPNIRK